MLQRLGIRGKILAVVAVPIIVLLFAAGYITLQATNALGVASNAQQLVATAQASQPFQAAFGVERDSAANYVDTYSTGQADRTEAQASIQTSMQQLQPRDANAYAKVTTIFEGGQEVPGGTALSLDDARAVAPTQPDQSKTDDWPVWPALDQISLAKGSLAAMSDDVAALAKSATGDTDTKEILQSIADQLNAEAAATEAVPHRSAGLPDQFPRRCHDVRQHVGGSPRANEQGAVKRRERAGHRDDLDGEGPVA